MQTVWCDEQAPLERVASVGDSTWPLVIIGHEVAQALVCTVEVKRWHPTVRVVLLVVLLADKLTGPELLAALKAGATTVLGDGSTCDVLIQTLKLVAAGSIVIPNHMLDLLLDGDEAFPPVHSVLPIPSRLPSPTVLPSFMQAPHEITECGLQELANFSAREISVLRRLVGGLSNKEIGAQLEIAEATVKVHVKAILRKVRLRNRTQVATWASRRNLPLSGTVHGA